MSDDSSDEEVIEISADDLGDADGVSIRMNKDREDSDEGIFKSGDED